MRKWVLLGLLGIFPPSLFAAPFFVDNSGNPVSPERTICGSNDMLKMLDQDEAMKKMGSPIGIYKAQSGGGASMCTGTLIDRDLFLTARHCLGACSGITVKFGFHARGNGHRPDTFPCKEIVEKGGSAYNQDYLIVRLDGNPGVDWGWYPVSDRQLSPKDELLMIHHPMATPMKISRKDCAVKAVTSGGMLEHRCDTESGSSGSSILVPDYERTENTRVVGVHTLGGCNSSATSSNSGPSMRHLVTLSPVLKALAKP